jgi:hypothetical protein
MKPAFLDNLLHILILALFPVRIRLVHETSEMNCIDGVLDAERGTMGCVIKEWPTEIAFLIGGCWTA